MYLKLALGYAYSTSTYKLAGKKGGHGYRALNGIDYCNLCAGTGHTKTNDCKLCAIVTHMLKTSMS